MNFLSCFLAFFALLGGIDRILGNRFGLGERFEKGLLLLGNMALAMIGMLVLSPWIAQLLEPLFQGFYRFFRLDPSLIPAMLFANDMGGAALAREVAVNGQIGMFNALIVSCMMGGTLSFTLPYSIHAVDRRHHSNMFLGFLCGILTIPLGCLCSGLLLRIPFGILLADLIPLILFSALIALGLYFCPKLSIKIFSVLGKCMEILITAGLILGIIRFLTGFDALPHMGTLEDSAMICLNAAVVMTGALPFLHIVSRVIDKPLAALGRRLHISKTSALGFLASLANSITTFEMMDSMDPRGIVLNSAFAISSAFALADHLAFTMAFDQTYILPMIAGKLLAGLTAMAAAATFLKRTEKKNAIV